MPKESTTIELLVPKERARLRLDQFLARELPKFSRSRLQQLIRKEFVMLNGAPARPRDLVRAGARLLGQRRGEFFERFALALLTFPQSLETELSMRTRVYDYLWGGLPIVSSSAPGTDEILTRYRCGTIVHEATPRAFADAILRTFAQQSTMRSGTRDFVREHQWPEALQPLRDFCRKPRIDTNKDAFAVRMQVPERPPSILARSASHRNYAS